MQASPVKTVEARGGVREPVPGEGAVPTRAEHARAARLRVWAPVALRAVALGVALLGLAAIGSVVGHATPQPALAPSASHAELGFGALSSRALDLIAAGSAPAVVGGVSSPDTALSAEPPPATPSTSTAGESASSSSTSASAASTASAAGSPCREGRDSRAPPSPGAAPAAPPAAERHPDGTPTSPVVLNRADAAELQRLPGVGAKRAEAILALRQRLGRFRRPSELLRVKGIGPRTLERMLPHLVLD